MSPHPFGTSALLSRLAIANMHACASSTTPKLKLESRPTGTLHETRKCGNARPRVCGLSLFGASLPDVCIAHTSIGQCPLSVSPHRQKTQDNRPASVHTPYDTHKRRYWPTTVKSYFPSPLPITNPSCGARDGCCCCSDRDRQTDPTGNVGMLLPAMALPCCRNANAPRAPRSTTCANPNHGRGGRRCPSDLGNGHVARLFSDPSPTTKILAFGDVLVGQDRVLRCSSAPILNSHPGKPAACRCIGIGIVEPEDSCITSLDPGRNASLSVFKPWVSLA